MRIAKGLFGLLLVTGCLGVASISLAAPPHTGIQGRATVCSPCGVFPGPPVPGPVAPVQTTITVVSVQNGRAVAQALTDSNGYFQIALPRGRYVLMPHFIPRPSEPGVTCVLVAPPIELTVTARKFVVAAISYAPACESPQ